MTLYRVYWLHHGRQRKSKLYQLRQEAAQLVSWLLNIGYCEVWINEEAEVGGEA